MLAKYPNPILSRFIGNENTVKDYFYFAEDFFSYEYNLYIASVDVESLFTSIPLDKTIKTLHKKRSFPLRISSVNVTKSAVSCDFGQIYWRNP